MQIKQASSVNISYQQKLKSRPNIHYRSIAALSDKIVPNVILRVHNSTFNTGILPSDFNVGFNHIVCRNILSILVQLPYNNVILPEVSELMQSVKSLLQQQNGFYNPFFELSIKLHSFYFGPCINNNTVAFNMLDRVLRVIIYSINNFQQIPLFCTLI